MSAELNTEEKRKPGRPPKAQRRIAPLEERENMKHELSLLQQDEQGESPEFSREMKKYISQDIGPRKSVNQQHIKRLEQALANSQPGALSEHERIELEREEKLLETEVSALMVPKRLTMLKQFEGTTMNTEFRKAASEMAKNEFSNAYLKKAHRLKNIRRQLRPDDPDAGNLEFIRPD